jgi:hypothetical protein
MKVSINEYKERKSIELKLVGKDTYPIIFELLASFGYLFNKKTKIWFKPNASADDYASILSFFKNKEWELSNVAGVEHDCWNPKYTKFKTKNKKINKTTPKDPERNTKDESSSLTHTNINQKKTQSKNTLGSLPDNFTPIQSVGTQHTNKKQGYALQDQIGEFIGFIEPYKYAIVVDGESFAGKSRFLFMLANAFAKKDKKLGFYSLEMGDQGQVIQNYRDSYITASNQKNVAITSTAKDNLQTIKDQAQFFDVIIIDSWQKLGEHTSIRFDELRHEYPEKVWIVVFQQNAEGGTKGGSSSGYDAPVHIKVKAPDGRFDYTNNYAQIYKNRITGVAGAKFNLLTQKIVHETQD